MSETSVATESSSSRRTITIASVLLLLVLLPAQSQTPSPSETPIPGTTRRNVAPTTLPSSRNAAIFVPRQPTPAATPSPINEPRFIPRLDVSPSPPVDVDQQVTFTVVPKLPGAVEYRFNFGDGKTSDWVTEPFTTHQYGATKLYFAYAEIRRPEGRLTRGTINTARKEVEVRPRSSPTPSATSSVTIRPSPYSPSPTAIAPSGFITATPPGSGNNIASASPTATGSSRKHYTASPTPVVSNGGPPPGKASRIYYIVSAGLAILVLAYLIFLRSKPKIPMAARPTFHPHSDWEGSQRSPENVAINYELHFDSNVSSGRNWLETGGPILILRKTKQ